MSTSIEAYPLQWPSGWKRTLNKQNSRFKPTSFARSRDDLFSEIRKLGAKGVVLSTNVPLKLDGLPYAKFSAISDTGVAVYFTYKGKQMVFACDAWKSIEENTTSITRTIEAIRGIERWGASEMLERAFTGFAQLEAPTENWWTILGVNKDDSIEIIKSAWKAMAKSYHPDMGGSQEAMSRINHAYDQALKDQP